jgi:hypothetical protein
MYKVVDHANRLAFRQQLLNMINDNPDLVNNLLMSDEAHFQLSGFVSKQNFHYLSSKNPQRFHEKLLHSVKVTIWCAISSFGICRTLFL